MRGNVKKEDTEWKLKKKERKKEEKHRKKRKYSTLRCKIGRKKERETIEAKESRDRNSGGREKKWSRKNVGE